jgi:hypothetical protein
MMGSRNLQLGAATLSVALALIFLPGCGAPGRALIQGNVTFNGEPVDGGVILFTPEGDTPAPKPGGDIVAGKYSLAVEHGFQPGNYRVEIRWKKKTGRQVMSSDPPNMMDETKQVIPPEFNTKSTLARELKSGTNTLDFELTGSDKPEKPPKK